MPVHCCASTTTLNAMQPLTRCGASRQAHHDRLVQADSRVGTASWLQAHGSGDHGDCIRDNHIQGRMDQDCYQRVCTQLQLAPSLPHPLTHITNNQQPGLPRLSLKGASHLRQYHKCHALHTLSSLSTFCHWSLCPSRDTSHSHRIVQIDKG